MLEQSNNHAIKNRTSTWCKKCDLSRYEWPPYKGAYMYMCVVNGRPHLQLIWMTYPVLSVCVSVHAAPSPPRHGPTVTERLSAGGRHQASPPPPPPPHLRRPRAPRRLLAPGPPPITARVRPNDYLHQEYGTGVVAVWTIGQVSQAWLILTAIQRPILD